MGVSETREISITFGVDFVFDVSLGALVPSLDFCRRVPFCWRTSGPVFPRMGLAQGSLCVGGPLVLRPQAGLTRRGLFFVEENSVFRSYGPKKIRNLDKNLGRLSAYPHFSREI